MFLTQIARTPALLTLELASNGNAVGKRLCYSWYNESFIKPTEVPLYLIKPSSYLILEQWEAIMDLQDRRVKRTQKALARALIELTLEKGYEAITIRDITDKAEVGYATFFRHYHD